MAQAKKIAEAQRWPMAHVDQNSLVIKLQEGAKSEDHWLAVLDNSRLVWQYLSSFTRMYAYRADASVLPNANQPGYVAGLKVKPW